MGPPMISVELKSSAYGTLVKCIRALHVRRTALRVHMRHRPVGIVAGDAGCGYRRRYEVRGIRYRAAVRRSGCCRIAVGRYVGARQQTVYIRRIIGTRKVADLAVADAARERHFAHVIVEHTARTTITNEPVRLGTDT